MTIEKEDVNPTESSPVDEQEETQGVIPIPSSPEAAEEETSTSPAEGVKPGEETDEHGVPWKNREAELRRKVMDEIQPWLRQELQEAIRSNQTTSQSPTQTTQQNPLTQYTDEQLVWIEENDQNWKYAARVEREKRIEERASKKAYSTLKEENNKTSSEQRRGQSMQRIVSKYPEVFDTLSRTWNISSPLYQRAMQIYGEAPKDYDSHPEGLEVAIDRAFASLMLENRNKAIKTQIKQTGKERKEQKIQSQAMSSGKQTPPVTTQTTNVTRDKLMQEYQRTRDPKVLAQILRSKGIPVPTE